MQRETRSDPKGKFVYHIAMKLKLFLLSIVALLSLVAYQKYSEYSALKSIDSYESCVAANGSTIQESYPATCITRLGTRFTQPVKNKTYTNQKLGIQFEYPEDWQLLIDDNSPAVRKDEITVGVNRYSKSELPTGYTNPLSWFNDLKLHTVKSITPNDGYYYGSGSDTPYKFYMYYKFSNMESKRYGQFDTLVTSNSGTGVSYVIIPTEKYIYEINLQPTGIYTNSSVVQILSTFKFTD